MKNLNKKNILIAAAILVAIIAIVLVFVFSGKSDKDSKKGKQDYTLVFDYVYEDGNKNHTLKFDYKKGKLKDVVLTLYFTDTDIAEEVLGMYLEEAEYTTGNVEGTKVILHYSKDELAKYSPLTKKKLIASLKEEGYTYVNKK